MNAKRTEKLMAFLLGISALAIMVGALLKLGHNTYADFIFKGGFLSGLIFSWIEISRLKKVIFKLKNERMVAEE